MNVVFNFHRSQEDWICDKDLVCVNIFLWICRLVGLSEILVSTDLTFNVYHLILCWFKTTLYTLFDTNPIWLKLRHGNNVACHTNFLKYYCFSCSSLISTVKKNFFSKWKLFFVSHTPLSLDYIIKSNQKLWMRRENKHGTNLFCLEPTTRLLTPLRIVDPPNWK